MDLGLRPELSAQQRLELRLSPAMIQSMEILQLTSLDLQEKIEEELEENPVLELAETEGGAAPEGAGELSAADEAPAPLPEESVAADSGFTRLLDFSQQSNQGDWEDYKDFRRPRFGGEEDPKLEALQNLAGRPLTLAEHLEGQLAFVTDDARQTRLARQIIGNLDDNGYVRASPDEILASLTDWDPPVTRDEMVAAVLLVQSLEPPGVAAKDLRECLLLQLAREAQAPTAARRVAEAIVKDHLEDLGHNRLPKIARDLRRSIPELGEISVDLVKEAHRVIANLDPRPGRTFGGMAPKYVRPDVVVEKIDGRYEVRVESSYFPRLRVRSEYRALLSGRKGDSETKKFLRNKFQDAEFLMKALAMRENTLQRIATEVVELQQGFLEKGVEDLRPLRLQDVAERLEMHLSTVSRAISGKYIQTPRGIFEIKFFFPGGASREDGTSESRNSVIARLKELVEKEEKSRPLSDEQLAVELKAQGIAISRRTVTKYREAEGIPASRERKSY
jgi:RNA polymerase sigma-54 factor